MSSARNIMLLLTDDQRFDTIRELGNPGIHTPNMDGLVRSGVAFRQAFIPGGTVDAVCMPSRAMLHTGRTLFHLQNHGETIPASDVLLGEHLRGNGYTTFGIGKWHNGRESYARSFTGGDEIFFGGMDDHWNVPVYRFDPSGKYDAVLPMVPHPRETNAVVNREGDHMAAGAHSSRLFADAAIRFLDVCKSSAPFFLYVAFMAPHDPRTMPKQFMEMYDPAGIPLPRSCCGGHPFDNGALHVRDELLAGFPRRPAEIRRHIAEYYAMISHLDAEIGRILDAVKRNGFADDTIIVLAGDNGLALGRHGLMGKQNVYDHSVHVPLVMAGPGVPAGVQTDANAYLYDVFPTLCDLLGLPPAPSVEGISLRPALDDPACAIRDTLYFAYGQTMRSVRHQRYKLIEYAVSGERTTQLFDLEQDPSEVHNLSGDPVRKKTLERMRAILRDQAERCGDAQHPAGREFWQLNRF